jgi:hypothetical protein
MNCDFTRDYVDLITAQGEFFFAKISVNNDIWEFYVMYIGPEGRAGRFYYTIVLDTGDVDSASLKITLQCISINEDLDEIRQACKCIMLPADVIRSSLRDGNLDYFLNIGRTKFFRRDQ